MKPQLERARGKKREREKKWQTKQTLKKVFFYHEGREEAKYGDL